MEDLHGLLHRDYGLRPQGKSAPMGGTRPPPYNPNPNQNNHMSSSSMKDLFTDDHFGVLGAGSAAKATAASGFGMSSPAVGYDDIFKDLSAAGPKPSSTVPVYDAPVYDDDIFGGVHGVRSSSSAVSYDDVFSSARSVSPSFEDFLGGIGSNTATTPAPAPAATTATGSINGFDDLLPGFSSSQQPSPPALSRNTESKPQQQQDSPKKPIDDPFVVLDAGSYSSNASSTTFHDPPEDFGNPAQPVYTNDMRQSSQKMSGIDDIFDSFQQTVAPASSTAKSSISEKVSPGSSGASSPIQTARKVESSQGNFTSNIEENNMETFSGRGVADFDISTGPDINSKTFATKDSFSYGDDPSYYEDHIPQNVTPQNKPDKYSDSVPDKWITVEEVVLYTNPTLAPPPRRPPPPLFVKQRGSSKRFEFEGDANFMRDLNNHELPKSHGSMFDGDRQPVVSSFDTLEEFAMGGIYAQSNGEQKESNSAATASAAAMREAMEKAEAKLRQAKEARDREKEEKEREAKAYRAKEYEKKEREERMAQEARERQERERAARAAQEAREREEREREEQERERRRMEREHVDRATREARERAAAESRERAAAEAREKAQRAAVERATKEARERAVAEAREKAAAERERAEREAVERAAAEARQRAERAAVERAAAEARERAERAAVERAAAEARERAAAEARERAAAEKASVERAAAEVKMRSERAAVSRANAEARERAAAAAAKDRQRKSENDLESFFSNMSSRANSAPKQRPATPDSSFDDLFSNKGFTSEAPRKTPPVPPSGLKKNPAASSMTDDFNALFGNPKASGETFQEVEGETEERRRARLDRHQRTRERAEQALREKNERDLQAQREQAERHRIADTLDNEIKRWAAGKEGNLRTLLSTLQYILWPEAGWKPVSLNNLIDGRSLKKEYRKATLCVHPDKVQQKGATIQQKYIAEKVFDLLKEAWNKFESEEFF